MAEIWMDLKGYQGKYQVSNKGKIFSLYSDRVLKPSYDKDGYHKYCLILPSGKKKHERGHRLVALMFCNKPEGYNVTNHKNMVKDDNRAENLEWSTVSLNTKHAYDNCEQIRTDTLEASRLGAEVREFHLDVYRYGDYVGNFIGQRVCADALRIDRKTIYNSMRNNKPTRAGYTFEEVGDARANETK